MTIKTNATIKPKKATNDYKESEGGIASGLWNFTDANPLNTPSYVDKSAWSNSGIMSTNAALTPTATPNSGGNKTLYDAANMLAKSNTQQAKDAEALIRQAAYYNQAPTGSVDLGLGGDTLPGQLASGLGSYNGLYDGYSGGGGSGRGGSGGYDSGYAAGVAAAAGIGLPGLSGGLNVQQPSGYGTRPEYTDTNGNRPEYSGYGNRPEYTSRYQAQLDALANEVLNQGKFNYDFNADPMYQAYRDRYIQQARMAQRDAQGQAAALTGGYGSSYNQQVGQQAYQQYMDALNDVIPELRDQAYQEWLNENNRRMQNVNLLQDLENADYGRYRDAAADWAADRGFDYGMYRDTVGDWESDRGFNYGQYRDNVGDWQDERNFSYQQYRDSVQDAKDEREYQLKLALELMRNGYGGYIPSASGAAYAAAAPTSSSSSGSSSRKSSSGSSSGSSARTSGSTMSNAAALAAAQAAGATPAQTSSAITNMYLSGQISQEEMNDLMKKI